MPFHETDMDSWLTGEEFQPRWVVQDVLTRGSMVLLAGEAGVGKSFVSYHLALCVALGLPFLGRFPVERTRVLYVDEENSPADLRQYLLWLWRGLESPPVSALHGWFSHGSFQLGGGNWREVLRQKVRTFKPGLIVIDTATAALQIKDENDNGEASSAVGYLRSLQVDGDSPAVLVLKHAKMMDDGVTVRGAKAWVGSTDGTIYHVHKRGRPPKAGWRTTVLKPGKIRAFGLRLPIQVIPERIEGAVQGWRLIGENGGPDV